MKVKPIRILNTGAYEFLSADFISALKVLLRRYRGDTFAMYLEGQDYNISELIDLLRTKKTIVIRRPEVEYLNSLHKDRKK